MKPISDYAKNERDVLIALANRRKWSRKKLAEATQMEDRRLRRTIVSLRRNGWPICSSSDNEQSGYWIANTKDDWDGFIFHELRSRQKAINEMLDCAMETRLHFWDE